MIAATGSELKGAVEGTLPVLAMFSASWCPPCKVLKPIVDNYSKEVESSLRVLYIDVEENPEIAEELNILAMPTLVLFKGRAEVGRRLGGMSKSELKEFTGI